MNDCCISVNFNWVKSSIQIPIHLFGAFKFTFMHWKGAGSSNSEWPLLVVSGWNAPSNLGSVNVLERTGRKPQQMWSAQAKKKNRIWCCSHKVHSWALSVSDDLQWPLYKTHWRPFQAGHVILEALNCNHLSKIISFHLFIWLSCFWLHHWTRWRESFYRANRLHLCLTSKQFNSSFLLENSGISFPTQWDVSCPASVSLRSSWCMYGFPRSFYSQTAEILPLPAHTKSKTFSYPRV